MTKGYAKAQLDYDNQLPDDEEFDQEAWEEEQFEKMIEKEMEEYE